MAKAVSYLSIKTGNKKDALVEKWVQHIADYDSSADKWLSQCKKILRIYSAKRPTNSNDDNSKYARFNLLWANIQTMLPAIYAKLPQTNIQRRFKDDDDIGRVTSDILERCTNFILDCTGANDTFRTAIMDYLLCGRAVLWARYEAEFTDTENTEIDEETGEEEVLQDLDYEEVKLDYVNYKDFGHICAEHWDDVTAVWRKIYLSRAELIEYFGKELGKEVPLNCIENSNDANTKDSTKKATKACVYEIWDKNTKKVIWLTKDYHKAIKIKDDFLNLKDFFPCPKPLYSTITNDSLIPIPDYILYQDQAIQLDELSQRIKILTKAVRVTGTYDATMEGLERILTENSDNQLYPVKNWQSFSEKGGLQGGVSFLPIKEIADVLLTCFEAFDKQKAMAYEITGISDLLRGQSNANETATAQDIKANYASMRFQDKRAEVSRFLRDGIQIMTEIVAEKFEPETLKLMSNVKMFENQEQKQQVQFAIQQGQLPQNEQMQDMLNNPTWQETIDFIRDDRLRTFRIDIETDSTIRADEQQEKAERLEFLQATAGFLKEAYPIATSSPKLAPVLGQMLLMGARSFKAGKTLEGQLEALVDELNKGAKQPQQPQPNPEMMKLQAEQQAQQAQIQLEGQKLQLEFAKLEIEKAKLAQIPQIKQMELEHNIYMDNAQAQREAQENALQAQLDQQTAVNEQQQQSLDTLRTAQIELQKEIQLKSIDVQSDRENQELEVYKIDKEAQTKENIALLNAKTSLQSAKHSANKGNSNGKM